MGGIQINDYRALNHATRLGDASLSIRLSVIRLPVGEHHEPVNQIRSDGNRLISSRSFRLMGGYELPPVWVLSLD